MRSHHLLSARKRWMSLRPAARCVRTFRPPGQVSDHRRQERCTAQGPSELPPACTFLPPDLLSGYTWVRGFGYGPPPDTTSAAATPSAPPTVGLLRSLRCHAPPSTPSAPPAAQTLSSRATPLRPSLKPHPVLGRSSPTPAAALNPGMQRTRRRKHRVLYVPLRMLCRFFMVRIELARRRWRGPADA